MNTLKVYMYVYKYVCTYVYVYACIYVDRLRNTICQT